MQPELEVREKVQNVHLEGRNHQMDKSKRRLLDELIYENIQGMRFQEHPGSKPADLRP